MRSAACAVAVAAATVFLGLGCFRFKEDEARTVTLDSGTAEVAVVDAAPDVVEEAGATMCSRAGGKAVVDKAMGELVNKLKTDCRIDRYFLSMAPDRVLHMQECMAGQIAWIMRCPGLKYPATDSKGEACRDIHLTHKGLAIHTEDFDAMLDDILSVLTAANIAQADLVSISDALKIQRTDIVNPGDAGRGDACRAETSGADSGVVDTGEEY